MDRKLDSTRGGPDIRFAAFDRGCRDCGDRFSTPREKGEGGSIRVYSSFFAFTNDRGILSALFHKIHGVNFSILDGWENFDQEFRHPVDARNSILIVLTGNFTSRRKTGKKDLASRMKKRKGWSRPVRPAPIKLPSGLTQDPCEEDVVVSLVDVTLVVVEVVIDDPLAVTAVCACCPLPRTVTMYFCPETIPWVGVCPCNRAKAPIVRAPL